MELREWGRILRQRWWGVALCVLLGIGAAVALTASTAPTFRASARVYFTVSGGADLGVLVQGGTYSQRQVATFVELARVPYVLDAVIDDLDLDVDARELARRITASVATDTSLVRIAVTGPDAREAAAIADAVARELVAASGRLSPRDATGASTISGTIVESAAVPAAPVSPRPRVNLALGLLAGLVAGIGYAALRQLADNKVRREEDVEDLVQLPVLGRVPRRRRRSVGLVADTDPFSPTAEAMRVLRANIEYVGRQHSHGVVAVTSAVPREGRTAIAIDLALGVARGGARVCLVDANVRSPQLTHTLAMDGVAGLVEVLAGTEHLDDVVRTWRDELDVLPAGRRPPNPTELLASSTTSELLRELERRYDVVVIDTPALLTVADGLVVARAAPSVLLVADVGHVTRAQLRSAVQMLRQAGANVLGVTLNRVRRGDLVSGSARPVVRGVRRRGPAAHAAEAPLARSSRALTGPPGEGHGVARTSEHLPEPTAEAPVDESADPASVGSAAGEAAPMDDAAASGLDEPADRGPEEAAATLMSCDESPVPEAVEGAASGHDDDARA